MYIYIICILYKELEENEYEFSQIPPFFHKKKYIYIYEVLEESI